MTIILLFSFSGIQSIASASTSPKITIKNYKNNKNFQYAVISGNKYKSANKKMLNYVKSIYKQNATWTKEYNRLVSQGDMVSKYFSYTYCKVKYNKNNKISITCENDYLYGTMHYEYQLKTFNFYKGKSISLKGAFKNKKAYVAANNYVKSYIMNHKNKYPLANEDTEMYNHEFYWYKDYLRVAYNPYELDAWAQGIKTVPVPHKYLKY